MCNDEKKLSKYKNIEKMFFLLPLMHSEVAADVRYCEAIAIKINESANIKIFGMMVQMADGHACVVEEYGRYPSRNKALGRVNTPEEQKYLDSGVGWGLKKKIFPKREPYGKMVPVIQEQ